MELNDVGTLPLTNELEAPEMPEIVCVDCGHSHELMYRGWVWGTTRHPSGSIRGVLTCYRPLDPDAVGREAPCEGQTLFQLTQNAISWAPGKLFQEDLKTEADNAKEMFQEALLCFYGASNRGTVAMCRSAVEEALGDKNVPGRDLDSKIKNAPAYILGPEEISMANGARLSGRNVLHHMAQVTHTQAMVALTTTIDLINHIAQQEPMPELQPEKDSNGR